MQRAIGGERLGSEGKMDVQLHGWGSTEHVLSRAWRSTMAQGTLVPCFLEPALNGDEWTINVAALVRTVPTLGLLFGSAKLQIDFFVAPLRLYQMALHNNKMGIGLHMEKMLLPKYKITGNSPTEFSPTSNPNSEQINPSCILSYLGLRGLGYNSQSGSSKQLSTESRAVPQAGTVTKYVEATPFLAYWDIFKNYYSNKQLDDAFVISGEIKETAVAVQTLQVMNQHGEEIRVYTTPDGNKGFNMYIGNMTSGDNNNAMIILSVATVTTGWYYQTLINVTNIDTGERTSISLAEAVSNGTLTFTAGSNFMNDFATFWSIDLSNMPGVQQNWTRFIVSFSGNVKTVGDLWKPVLKAFPLKNLDQMREDILMFPSDTPYIIDQSSLEPYSTPLKFTESYGTATASQCGLAVKCYLSDRFNNWLSTEWIEGANGINELSAVDVSEGSLRMDAFYLSKKLYDMLNRVAVSGGTYQDWQEVQYGDQVTRFVETPYFAGGNSQEINFSEITSSSDAPGIDGRAAQPLGSYAARGISQDRSQTIYIDIYEPSYIIGLVSITPRLDYSQGNRWFTRLETMADLHVPALDGIGFQELITDEMAAWDTTYDNTGQPIYKSCGKQPAWVHYMTAVNETYGHFANNPGQMFMTFNRNYEIGNDESGIYIRDLTTYIDPQKYNGNFAVQDLSAQNFWVQLGIQASARRKMSAKQIPNL